MYVEMDNGDNSPYMAHPLIISAHVRLQSHCVVSYMEVFVFLGMILAVSGGNKSSFNWQVGLI